MITTSKILLILNILTFIIYGIDKLKARNHRYRISEATLLSLAIMGGSIGAYLGMKLWHHKTRRKKFRYGIPIILFIQIAIATYIFARI